MDEVVEVPCLQAGVLAVVREREQLLGRIVQIGSNQVPQGVEYENRRRRTPTLAGQAGQLREFATDLAFVVGIALAIEAKPKDPRNVPSLEALQAHLPGGVDEDLLGLVLAIVSLQSR